MDTEQEVSGLADAKAGHPKLRPKGRQRPSAVSLGSGDPPAALRSLRHGNELIGGTDAAVVTVVTVVFGAMENHGPGFSIPK